MSLCREWTLVKHDGDRRHARPLYCRSWSCDVCKPRRKAQLLALAASGQPNRFVTLTVNPATLNSPEERLLALSNAWRIVVKRLRRLHGPKAVNYLAVVEQTKQGEPHLHILLRSPYVPQAWLSAAMRELIDAPIVDIRRVRSTRKAVTYVAKYVTKNPQHFAGAKRYWSTPSYELDNDYEKPKADDGLPKWHVTRENIHSVLLSWREEGWWTFHHDGERLEAVYLGVESLWRSIREPNGP